MLARIVGAEEAPDRGQKGHEFNRVLSVVLIGTCAELQAYEPRILMSFRI